MENSRHSPWVSWLMEKPAPVAVVELSGKMVSVTLFEDRPDAMLHAMSAAKECSDKTLGEIADSLLIRSEFEEGDYKVVLMSPRWGDVRGLTP